MSLDFATYRPPGTYVEETSTPVSTPVGTQPTLVALVGPSLGYRVYAETLVLPSTTPVLVTKLGGITASVVVTSLDGATTYDLTDDYLVAPGAGDDGDIGDTLDNTMTIARVSNGAITEGASVRVTYHYVDAAYYEAVRVADFEVVKDLYGEPFSPATGAITSPLSMAAKVAFENGARELILLATEGTSSVTAADLAAAYPKILNLHSVGVVVPVTAGITSDGDLGTAATDLVNHCVNASADGFYRIGVIGIDTGYTTGTPQAVAESANSSRVMVAWPNKLLYYNAFTGTTVEVGGQYLAAAYAGKLVSRAVQHGLTRKGITSFAGISATALATMTKANKDTWSDGGVAVTELTRNNTLIVRHGTSTDTTSTVTREVSVTRAKDQMIRLIQDSIDSAQVIGSPLTNISVSQIKAIVGGVLENCKDSEIIVDYSDLVGRIRPGDPQVIEVKFMYRPAWPLNYILVSFSIDTTTGTTEFGAGTNLG